MATTDESSTRRLLNERRDSEIRGGLPPKPKPKTFMDAVMRFFGIHDDDEERQLWRARQEHYLRKRRRLGLKNATHSQHEGQGIADDVFMEPGSDFVDGVEMAPIGQRKKTSSTGRSLDKRKQPEHRVKPSMPSVVSMVVSGVRTLLKTKPASVGDAPPVVNARSFHPGEDSDDDASDVSDDGQCFYCVDETSAETDGHPGKLPPLAVKETQPLTSKKLIDVKPFAEDVVDGEQPSRAEYNRAIQSKGRGLKHPPPDDLYEDRRDVGLGWFGRWFRYSYKEAKEIDPDTRKKIEDVDLNRPYFTCWLLVVQVVIMIVTLAVYDLAPVGVDLKEEQRQVLTTSLAIESRGHQVEQNPWIGPSYVDLIHLGAKYGPCMRRDKKVHDTISKEREIERDSTACCVRLDRSGCVQLTKQECDRAVFTEWLKWDKTEIGGKIRSSGSVCGQDPRDCLEPQSTGAHQWPDDITQWPICRSRGNQSHLKNMRDEVTGRPCCIGIQGECVMATEEECDFLDGYYHEDYSLCSQVNCMKSICGLSHFLDPDSPDQFYRIWTSLFLHVGIIHCVITIVFEIIVLPDLERLAGWLRIMLIFILSGIGGNIVSAFFTPYQAEVGPSGSLFGLIAALVMEVVDKWAILRDPLWDLGKLLLFIIILFIVGFLPFVDNYAHVGGFVFGLLSSAVLLPYIVMEKKTRMIVIAVAAPAFVILFTLFFLLFYLVEDFDCSGCKYFSCIPFTDTFCQNLDTKLLPRNSDLQGL